MFIEVYAKRYPSAYKRFNEIKNTPNKYRENPAYIDRFLKLTGLEFNFFCFLVYSSEMQEIIERLLDLHYRDDMRWMEYSFYTPDKNMIDDMLILDNGDDIFNSSVFKKYISRQRQAIADYLDIDERKLNQYIHDEMKSHRSDEGKTLNEKNQQNGW